MHGRITSNIPSCLSSSAKNFLAEEAEEVARRLMNVWLEVMGIMGNQTTSVEKDLCCNLISALSLINMTVIHSFLRMLHLKCYTTFGAVAWFKGQYH